MSSFASVPQKKVGPLFIKTPGWEDHISVPMATFESPVWYSVNRGARLSRACGGINTVVLSDVMTRSLLLQANSSIEASQFHALILAKEKEIAAIIESTSCHAKYNALHLEQVGRLLYLRCSITPSEASGHNMATKAADAVGLWLADQYPNLDYLSVSSNTCADKKATAVNGIVGRGKHVCADISIPASLCQRYLNTTPDAIHQLNIKKNLVGSILSGAIRSANAHFANMLLATYLATGQDCANIIEGSQGIVVTDVHDNGDLFFSVTLPNIIVGVIGNGKTSAFVQENLKLMGCLDQQGNLVANASQRLAMIIAASVLCGELSLLAAQTIPGQLTRSHIALERRKAHHE